MKAGYTLLATAACAFSLLMGVLGHPVYFVLFGGISLYFLKQVVARRKAPASVVAGAYGIWDRERGGFPLVVVAVAAMLLGISAASFAMNAAAINRPDDGVCDYDRAAAIGVDRTTAVNGTVIQRREFCDDHTGFYLLVHPQHPYALQPASTAGVTYLDRPISFWVPLFSGLWAAYALLMIAASVNSGAPAAGRESVLVICGYSRGVLAIATGVAATLLFVLVAAGLAGPAEQLDTTGPAWLLYVAMMVVFVAFLATFFHRRGGGG